MTAIADDVSAPPDQARPRRRWVIPAVVVTLAVGIVLRFLAFTPLWLDEAQTVAISHRPLGAVFSALRVDGSPPLFYLLLHFWMAVFGTGTFAVRSLAGLIAVLALPLTVVAARRLGLGRTATVAALLLLATCPFAVGYATEARMYSLVLVLSLLAIIAFERVWRVGRAHHVAAAALVTAALLLTHYWSLFAYAVGGGIAVVLALRRCQPESAVPARRVVIALALALVPFAPWVPTFVFQTLHTGAPWGKPPGIDTALLVPEQWAGIGSVGTALSVGYYLLVIVALAGHRVSGGFRFGQPVRRLPALLIGIGIGALVLGCLAGEALGSAYADRYSTLALAPALLVCGVGAARLPRRWSMPVLTVVVALGLVGSAMQPALRRTQAAGVARHLRAAAPGDVVLFCPDQLGPAVHRLAPTAGRQLSYPGLTNPTFVDWVDYAKRIHHARPAATARQVMAAAAGHTIWYVYATDYPLFKTSCARLLTDLTAARGRPRQLVAAKAGLLERDGLAEFRPGMRSTAGG